MRREYIIVTLTVISLIMVCAMLYVFWWGLLIGYDYYGKYVFIVVFNQIGEFWFEFIMLHIILISIFYFFRKADVMNKRH